ncbi:MAG: hypothetical protein Q8L78_07690 [Coxiellaceae bacterium]|nr:hypothetical protein [Coxiellaceae bacterium]
MRIPSNFLEKRKGIPFECGEKTYRSALYFREGPDIIALYVEHVPGKPIGTPAREVEAGRFNAGICEAKRRYEKSGGQALIKSVVMLNEKREIIAHFALKCFYKNKYVESSRFAEQEVESWKMFGENASIFFRKSGDSFAAASKVYMLMPWIEGCDLQQFFSDANKVVHCNIDARIQLFSQIFSKLQLIGLAGKVFSDFKLENIMYDEMQNKIFLVDVGLIDNGTKPSAVTRNFLDPEKRAQFLATGGLNYDWQDQMYAFGMLAASVLALKTKSVSDNSLGITLSAMMRAIFCNPDKTARPMPSDDFIQVLQKHGHTMYRHNSYESNGASVVKASKKEAVPATQIGFGLS